MTTEEKDAEIERLKGELAEALAVLKPFDRSLDTGFRDNIILQAFDDDTQEYWCVGPSIGDMRAVRAFLQKHTPPLNCGSAAAGESPSHSGGGVVCTLCGGSGIRELPLGCMGSEVCALCLGTGKSALREVPPTGDDHSTGETSRQGPEGSTPSLPANHKKGEA